tara:strand:- start:246 stop:719 length:474 start_codon:yes stop_codon:yes gene_type:complete
MKKVKKNNLFSVIFILLFFFSIPTSIANNNFYFLSLKNDEVNLRQGPSFEYPIKLIYKKKYLPVMILNKSETWREIKDFENNSGWMHISQLSKKKSAINLVNNSIIYKKYSIYSKPIVKLEVGRLVLIHKCKIKWCKVTSNNYSGWILKDSLWGKVN